MAWDDPSPRTRAHPARSYPVPQPGYGAEPPSPGRWLWCLVQSGLAGVMAALGAHGLLARWHGPAGRGGAADLLLAIVFGLVVAWPVWRYLSTRPGGGGWVRLFWRRRHWDDAYPGTTYTDLVVAEVVADVVGDVIDAVID